MRKAILTFVFLFIISFLGFAQCPDETYVSLGDFNFNEIVKVEATDQVFGIVHVSDTLEVGGQIYISAIDSLSKKVVVELDLDGNYVNSFEISSDYEFVAETFGNGYRNAGLISDGSQLYVPSIYFDETGRLNYNIQSVDFSGNLNWSKNFPASMNTGIFYGFDDVLIKQNGNLLISGTYADTLSIDGQQFSNIDQSTGFLLELDATNGDFIEITEIYGSNQMEFYNIKEDSEQNLYVAGNIYNADSIVVNGNTTNYTGMQSGHIFKLDNTGTFQWIHILESDFGLENFPLHVNETNSYIHYGAVHYESGGQDNTTTDAWVGALNMTTGNIEWEHELASTNWYYLAYNSWLDETEGAIYFSVWANNGGLNQIYMDGELLQDSVASRSILHKFSVDGTSEWISPIRFSSIGGIVDRGDGTVLSPIDYTSTPGTIGYTTGIVNPANFPLNWAYVTNEGGNTTSSAQLVASSSGEANSYQWYLSGDSIIDATDSVYIPTEAGSYWVDIESPSGCITRSGAVGIGPGNTVQSDSIALVQLYNATGGDSWNNNSGWLETPLSDWFGIQVNGEGRVSYIDLNSNNLIGELPSSFQDMTEIQEIFLYNNPELTGDFQDLILNKGNLLRLRAHDCNFSGEIPVEITTHTNMVDLAMFQNNISGSLPTDLGNLINLEYLNFSNNTLEGEIPGSIGELQNVLEISLSNNNLSGPVPNSIENLSTLESLNLYQNNLEGTLPDVLHLPSLINLDVYGNGKLFVEIPDDLGTLTNLQTFAIGATVANKGEFPEGFYQLTNLVRLDVGGQQFTGGLTEDVANWTQLDNLYLWQNQLSGDLPAALASIGSLRIIDISQNNFTSVPDFSATSLQELSLVGNQLSFNSLIPNLTIPTFNFRNQARIGGDQDVELSISENYEITTEIQDEEGTQYSWIFNNDTIATDQLSLTVNNFSIAKSGSYRLLATHPDIADFFISSGFTNLKISGEPRTWYVDNRPNTARDFNSLYQAIYASNANDTIYIAGSPDPYQSQGSLLLNSPRVILGPGYFLDQNEGLQFNTEAAIIGDVLTLAPGSDGSQIFGVSFNAPVRLNNTFFTEGDTLRNISFIGNRFLEGSNFGFVSHIEGLTFKGNYNPLFAFYITDAPGEQSGLYANYQNFDISNNINIRVRPFNFQFSTSAVNNGMDNIVFSNNLIDTIANINDAVFENNIIKPHSSNGNTFNNNIDYAENIFENASGSLSVDSDFRPIDTGLTQGPFSGENPYQLSGLPPIPSINNIQIGSRLSAIINANSNNQNNIQKLRYQYRRNNQSSSPFNVRGFEANTEVEVEFLPNRSGLEPNQTYNLVFVAIDETGNRSHRTYIPYEAIAANLSGNVVDIDNIDVNEGNVRLFAINPFANKYDTAAVQTLAGSNTFNFENLILGDYIILADPDENEYPNLLPTYLGNTLDWQVADTLFLEQNTGGVNIEVEKEPEPLTEPGSEISGFIEEEYDEADSSLRVLPRRRVSGAGVSVRTLAGSSRPENSLRLLEDDYELVAYIKTDENGEFSFPNLPSGDYRIRVEYPGVENDETSDIDFNLSGEEGEVVSVEAVVEDGLIKVTETGRVTANEPEKITSFSFYPNPAKNELNLKLENPLDANELIIFDMRGIVHKKITLKNEQRKIDIKDIPTGTYILKLQDKNGNYIMSKMIKN